MRNIILFTLLTFLFSNTLFAENRNPKAGRVLRIIIVDNFERSSDRQVGISAECKRFIYQNYDKWVEEKFLFYFPNSNTPFVSEDSEEANAYIKSLNSEENVFIESSPIFDKKMLWKSLTKYTDLTFESIEVYYVVTSGYLKKFILKGPSYLTNYFARELEMAFRVGQDNISLKVLYSEEDKKVSESFEEDMNKRYYSYMEGVFNNTTKLQITNLYK